MPSAPYGGKYRRLRLSNMTTMAFTGLLSTVLYMPGIEKVSCATVTGANGDAPRSKPAAEAAAASQPTVVVIVADQLRADASAPCAVPARRPARRRGDLPSSQLS